MSRIGKQPVAIPSGVEVTIEPSQIKAKGPKGTLSTPVHEKIRVNQEGQHLVLSRVDDSRTARAQHGLRRTLLANLLEGVSRGFEKSLEVVGVGYKVQVSGQQVVLNVGFSHPVEFALPAGIEARAEGSKLFIAGSDKQQVGEIAAQIRRIRPPEPFKGKGIRYVGEHIRRKAGKSGAK